MITASVAFLMSVCIAAVLTPLVRWFALNRGLVDVGNSRKIHKQPTPRLGGIAIVVAFFAPLLLLIWHETALGRIFWRDETRALGLFVGGICIALLGLVDDVKGVRAMVKFGVQFAIAGLMYYLGYRINAIANPFGEPWQLGMFGMPFTLIWIVGVINAINLIDGLDGLAGGVALFAVSTIFVISIARDDALMMLFMATLGGAILGFLFYNFNPATIFMGDTGSMFLGFILAATSIQTAQKASTAVALLIPIVILGLPIMDTLLAIARRAAQGRPLFSADKDHIHHRLLTLGLTQRQAALVLYAVCLLFAITAWMLTWANSGQTAVILAWLGMMSYLFMRKLGYIQFGQTQVIFDRRRRNRALLASVKQVGRQARDIQEGDELWSSIKPFVQQVDAQTVRLTLKRELATGETCTTVYALERGELRGEPLSLSFPLQGGPGSEALLELVWGDGRREVLRDDEIAVEQLCGHITGALGRMGSMARDRLAGPGAPLVQN